MSLTIDTTLLTNVTTWIGKAHNQYISLVGDEASQASPMYWLEQVKSYVRGGNDTSTGLVPGPALTPPGAPTLALAAGSNLGVGAYKYQITFVAGGETTGGTEASITTTTGNTNVVLTNIPLGPTGTTQRGIYRTVVGGATGSEHLVGFLNDNTTTTYTDSFADGSLAATAVPTVNTTGTPTFAAQGTPNNTIAITGGTIQIDGQLVAVASNAAYGNNTIWTQTCTDGSPLTVGTFYDASLCADIKGQLAVFRGPREDIPNTQINPPIPFGYGALCFVRVNYQAGGTTIINPADISTAPIITQYANLTNDPAARIFGDFDTGQTKLISRTAVKNELGFALTSLDNYVKTITASQGLGTNGLGLTLLAWAKSTHQTTTPFDFPTGFEEYVRYLKNGKDHSTRLATISFTGSGTATVTDLKKVIGFQDQLELVVTSPGGTGAAASTITVTTQSYGAASAVVWQATVPANSPNGTVITLGSSGTAPLQTPVSGTAQRTRITKSRVLSAQPAGTFPPSTRLWTALVPSSPVTVTGGTSGDAFAVRNTGVL